MKNKLCSLILLIMPLSLQAADESELTLKLQLPDSGLVLVTASPPQLQQEGLPLITEQDIANQLLEFINRDDYQAGLEHITPRYGVILDRLRAGDPEGLVRQSTVVGGFSPSTRSGQISSTMLYLIGHTFMQLEQYDTAETSFLTALVPLPDYLRVHEALGMLYLRQERFDEAHQHLAKAASLGLTSANLFAAMGYLNQKLNNHWGAVSAYQQALMLEPQNQAWQQSLLYALSETHQYQSGLTLAEQMLQSRPDEPQLWLYRSQMALQAGQQREALSSLETAIRLGEQGIANLQVCAALHLEFGSIARAVELLQTSFAAGMDFRYVEQTLEWLERQEEWEFLADMLNQIRQAGVELDDSQQSRLLVSDARLAEYENNDDSAIMSLQEALQLDPSNADAMLMLGGLYKDLGNLNQAELLFQRATAYEQYRENALLNLSQLAIDQDNFQRALELLQEVLQYNPERQDLRANIQTLQNLIVLEQGN